MSELLTTPPPRENRLRQLGEDIARWFRRNFARDSLIQAMKTFAWVGPLTCLIWVYAEREQVTTDNDVSISIDVRINDPQRIVRLKRPADKNIVASLRGPRSNLDQLISKLQHHGIDDPAVEITLPAGTQGELQEPDTAAALASSPVFRQASVSVVSCQPSTLIVELDTLEEVDVDVQVPPEVTNLVGKPAFDPHTVKARGPRRAMDAARASGKLAAYADLAGLDALKTPGSHEIAVVRIKPLEDSSLSFVPSTVAGTLFVRNSDVSYTIPSVPIWVYGSPSTLGRYRIDTRPQTLTNVKVTGPADQIDLLKRDDFQLKPHAMLKIDPEDAGKKSQSRQVRFDLPPDMNIRVSDEDRQRQVEFDLIDTTAHE